MVLLREMVWSCKITESNNCFSLNWVDGMLIDRMIIELIVRIPSRIFLGFLRRKNSIHISINKEVIPAFALISMINKEWSNSKPNLCFLANLIWGVKRMIIIVTTEKNA